MSGPLDEISQAIGELRAETREGARQREAIFRKLDEISARLVALPVMAAQLAEIAPHVNDYRKMKQRGIGILAGVTIAGGSIGASAKQIIEWLLGGRS